MDDVRKLKTDTRVASGYAFFVYSSSLIDYSFLQGSGSSSYVGRSASPKRRRLSNMCKWGRATKHDLSNRRSQGKSQREISRRTRSESEVAVSMNSVTPVFSFVSIFFASSYSACLLGWIAPCMKVIGKSRHRHISNC